MCPVRIRPTDSYSGIPGSVRFNAGETEKAFTVVAADDSEDTDGGSVNLGFGVLPAGVFQGEPATVVVTLTDDDDPVASSETTLLNLPALVTVASTSSTDPGRNVADPMPRTSGGGMTAGDNMRVPTGPSPTVDRPLSQTFTLTDENREGLTLDIDPLPTGTVAGTPDPVASIVVGRDDSEGVVLGDRSGLQGTLIAIVIVAISAMGAGLWSTGWIRRITNYTARSA